MMNVQNLSIVFGPTFMRYFFFFGYYFLLVPSKVAT